MPLWIDNAQVKTLTQNAGTKLPKKKDFQDLPGQIQIISSHIEP
jgi:hypothetical protein